MSPTSNTCYYTWSIDLWSVYSDNGLVSWRQCCVMQISPKVQHVLLEATYCGMLHSVNPAWSIVLWSVHSDNGLVSWRQCCVMQISPKVQNVLLEATYCGMLHSVNPAWSIVLWSVDFLNPPSLASDEGFFLTCAACAACNMSVP